MDTESGKERLLGADFWGVSALMALLSGLLMWGVVIFPIDQYLPKASSAAVHIDYLFKFMAFFSVPILVFVNGYMLYFAWRYRVFPGESKTDVGSDIHDHRALEAWWTIIPSALMVVLGILSYIVMPEYYLADAASDATVEAIGHTFFYEFRYPGLKDAVNGELHLPVDKLVTIDLTSAEANESKAVIHSFWAPEFRVKQDMIPGMIVPIHFRPTRIGTYRIICTEFCGLGHSTMTAKVVVESQADFDKWFAAQRGQQATSAQAMKMAVNLAGGDAAAGSALFGKKCIVCHSVGAFDEKKVGPGLGNLFADPQHPKLVNDQAATPENVAGIIQHGAQGPIGTMPTMQQNGLTTQDISNLVAYLRSIHK
jgi:cytochrome c oxidase subunit 2